MTEETHKRTLAKTLSWRVVATFITATLAWIITGDLKIGVEVGLADTLVKLVAYYGHERVWTRVRYGKPQAPQAA